MITRVETKDCYKFAELNERAQDNAIEELWDINLYQGWDEFVLDEWTGKLREAGFDMAKIYYSGFSSQGDGACFDADVDLTQEVFDKFCGSVQGENEVFVRMLNKHRAWFYDYLKEYCSFKVIDLQSLYYHEDTKRVEGQIKEETAVPGRLEECFVLMEDYLEELRAGLSHKLFRELGAEYEFLLSPKEIIETIEANEYEFNEEGSLL